MTLRGTESLTPPTKEPASDRPSRARRVIESRRVVGVASVFAIALTLVAVSTGLQTEDWVQRALVAVGDYRFPFKVNLYGHHGPWSLQQVEQRVQDYRAAGWFPWITYHRFDVSFWRPIASLTHVIDYELWPNSAWLMHLENVGWYGALAAVVAVAYRRLCQSAWLAGLAALAYAVDDTHEVDAEKPPPIFHGMFFHKTAGSYPCVIDNDVIRGKQIDT